MHCTCTHIYTYMSKGFNIFLHISFIHFKIKLMTVWGHCSWNLGGALGWRRMRVFRASREITASSERIKIYTHTKKFTYAEDSEL